MNASRIVVVLAHRMLTDSLSLALTFTLAILLFLPLHLLFFSLFGYFGKYLVYERNAIVVSEATPESRIASAIA